MDGWWDVFDEGSARTAAADIRAQLDRASWPLLDGMFSHEAMLARLRDGELGMMKRSNAGVFFARAEALLLMDAGPSDALAIPARIRAHRRRHEAARRRRAIQCVGSS